MLRQLRQAGLYALRTKPFAPSASSFSTSRAVRQTLEDPSRPGLYYHLLESTSHPTFAISFLPNPPQSPRSPTIIGYLPTEIAEETDRDGGDGLGLNDFDGNPAFLELLHKTVKDAIKEDEYFKAEAVQRGDGWMHISDARNPPALNRIPEPDDIIASVLVEHGEIKQDSYERMPTYRVCTAEGLTQLSDGLHQKLLDALRTVSSEESA